MVMAAKEATEVLHYAAIHHKKYSTQPNGKDMAYITNGIKQKGHAKLYNTQELFEALSNGQNVLLSNFEMDNNQFRFVSTAAFTVDVDDTDMVTNPTNVLHDLKRFCTGLFYTFSHNKKGNRYRLVFQLNRTIKNEHDIKVLIKYVMQRLKKLGLPVDEKISHPTQIIRGGISGYELNSLHTFLDVDEWLPPARAEYEQELKTLEKKREKQLKENLNNPTTYEELKEMCEAIGHIPTGQGYEVTQKWLQVVYALKHQVEIEVISDQEGYELFNIVSGGESSERYWQSLKPHGFVTVGTIMHHAQENGYVRKNKYKHAYNNVPEPIEMERINSKKYLSKEIAKDLLNREQNLIVDSPTGTGKTRNFLEAFKDLETKEPNIYIFAAPTIALSEQIAKEHGVSCIKGGIRFLGNEIAMKVIQGERVFISTYDKTLDIIENVKNGIDFSTGADDPEVIPKFYVVVDEIHQITNAYKYRFRAIDRFKTVADESTSFIGLTGTPEDTLKTKFDKLVRINTGNKKSPCNDFRVFTYGKAGDKTVSESGRTFTISLVRSLLHSTKGKVLLFINNKKQIKYVARKLKENGIKCSIVTSEDKKSPTYQQIVENGTVDDEIQVLISTTALADGISLKNKLDWSCVVVADRESPFFNPSTIKQISNRFRNEYRFFTLLTRTPSEEKSDSRRFNIEADYNYRIGVVKDHVEYLNQEYNGEDIEYFIPSKIEMDNGIHYKSTEENALIEYNELFTRHESMRNKERYYSLYRNAFIKEIENVIGLKATGVFNMNEELEKNGADISDLLEQSQEETENEKVQAEQLRSNFKHYFDYDVYMAFTYVDDPSTLQYFKNNVHQDHYSAAAKNSKIATFEACFTVTSGVTRKKDINVYNNEIKALVDIATFNVIKKSNITKKVYSELYKLTGETFQSSDFKDYTENKLTKKLKVSKKDMKGVLQMFEHDFSRKSNDRYTTLQPLTIQSVAERHGIPEREVKISIVKFILTKPPQQQKVMKKSVEKFYNIDFEKIQSELDMYSIKI